MEYENYIFDLYGTLIDLACDEQAPATWKKWLRWLDGHGIKHPEYPRFRREFFKRDKELRAQMRRAGISETPEIDVLDIYRDLFALYGNKKMSEDLVREASYAFRECSRSYIRLYPGVEEFLRKIRESGSHAYILSNAQASYTLPEIHMFSLDDKVDDYLMSSDYQRMKPDPAFFMVLMDKYQMDPAKTVMVGDSASSDMAGAKNAGIAGIHLAGENDAKVFYLRQL